MNIRLLFCFLLFYTIKQSINAQTPLYNSLSGAAYVVYLDFDGHTVAGSAWNAVYNSGNPIVCAASGFDAAKITTTFNLVAEDFRPFNINVTTDSTVFVAAPALQKVRVIITPTQGWFPSSAGGVAYLNSFTSPNNNMCFAFTGSLANNENYTAEASSHETGHTLGLNHHSDYNSSCVKTNEYLYGYGSGEISWAPIMGVGYYKNMTTWSNIAYNSSCAFAQSDLSVITAANNSGVAFKADDHANNIMGATNLLLNSGSFSDSGIITTNIDVDVFKLTVVNKSIVNINAVPLNFGSPNVKSDLDILLTLKDAVGNTLVIKNPTLTLNATISNVVLPAGDYYIFIDGTSNAYQNGYGSLGKYYLTGTVVDAVNTVVSANFIASDTNICKASTVYFSDQSMGNNTSWNWTFTGGTPSTFTGQNPGLVTFNTVGTFAVSLTISDGINSNTKTTSNYIKVNNFPTINISPATPISCGGQSVVLTATGASQYSWTPATNLSNNYLNNVNVNSITADATYTVIGTDANGCVNSKSVLVKYAPNPTLVSIPSIYPNAIYACKNDSVSMSVSGATTYLWSPTTGLDNSTTNNVKSSSPTANTIYYSVTGTDTNGCKGYANFKVVTRACDSLSAEFTSNVSAVCVGDSINFNDFSTGNPSEWKWSFAGANPSTSTAQNPGWVKYNTNGNYTVTLKSIKGTDTSTKIITNYIGVANYPNIHITPNTALICNTDSLNLTAATASGYLWDANASIFGSVYNPTIKVKPTITTRYYVTGTNYASSGGSSGGMGGFKQCTARDSALVLVNTSCALSLKFLAVNAKIFSKNILLDWQINQAENLYLFEIERSEDGINFYKIGSLSKNVNTSNYYQFIDEDVPSNKNIFYRIKAIEINGDRYYSAICTIKTNVNNVDNITIWPVPVSDILNIKIISKSNHLATIIIQNCIGEKIISTQTNLLLGNNTLKLSTASLKKGMYFLYVMEADNITVLKMLK